VPGFPRDGGDRELSRAHHEIGGTSHDGLVGPMWTDDDVRGLPRHSGPGLVFATGSAEYELHAVQELTFRVWLRRHV